MNLSVGNAPFTIYLNPIALAYTLEERFLIGKFHNPKKTLCWMFLCLTTASTIRSDMLRGRQTRKSFSVPLSGQFYKVDITCAMQETRT